MVVVLRVGIIIVIIVGLLVVVLWWWRGAVRRRGGRQLRPARLAAGERAQLSAPSRQRGRVGVVDTRGEEEIEESVG